MLEQTEYHVHILRLVGCWEVVQRKGAGRGKKTDFVGKLKIYYHGGRAKLNEATEYLEENRYTDQWATEFYKNCP